MTQRTKLQNKSLHLYFDHLAKAMDAAGLDMRTTINVPIRPNKDNVKETMAKPIMQALWPEIDSTTKLSTAQINELYAIINRFTAQKLGISVEFPSEETLSREDI